MFPQNNPLSMAASSLAAGQFFPSPLEGTAKPKPTGADLYARFAFAGAVCCSITHGALTPGMSYHILNTSSCLVILVFLYPLLQKFYLFLN